MTMKMNIITRAIMTVCVIGIFGLSLNLSYQFGKQEAEKPAYEYVSAAYTLGQEKALEPYNEKYLLNSDRYISFYAFRVYCLTQLHPEWTIADITSLALEQTDAQPDWMFETH